MKALSLSVLLSFVGVSLSACPDPEPGPELCIDRVRTEIYPPAGVSVAFRVIGCDGEPIRLLSEDDVTVYNDEKGTPFGFGKEGGALPVLGVAADFRLFTVLALDMSDSIHNSDAVDDVIDGAKRFIETAAERPELAAKHKIAIVAFGRPAALELVQDFSGDHALLYEKLEVLRNSPGRGSTDLYGAYTFALGLVDAAGSEFEYVERFMVILTDGTHEAGNERSLRATALQQLAKSDADVFSIGIEGAYDATRLKELASMTSNFLPDVESQDLTSEFTKVADKVALKAASNYVVTVCTPVTFGNPTLTIVVDADGKTGRVTQPYAVDSLNGDLGSCDPATLLLNPLCVNFSSSFLECRGADAAALAYGICDTTLSQPDPSGECEGAFGQWSTCVAQSTCDDISSCDELIGPLDDCGR